MPGISHTGCSGTYTTCAKRKMVDCLTIGHGMILS